MKSSTIPKAHRERRASAKHQQHSSTRPLRALRGGGGEHCCEIELAVGGSWAVWSHPVKKILKHKTIRELLFGVLVGQKINYMRCEVVLRVFSWVVLRVPAEDGQLQVCSGAFP